MENEGFDILFINNFSQIISNSSFCCSYSRIGSVKEAFSRPKALSVPHAMGLFDNVLSQL
jgi:hypothetical protein